MTKGISLFLALLAISCSGGAGPSPHSIYTQKKEGPVLNLILDKDIRTVEIKKGDLSGVRLKYVHDGDFDPIDLQLSRVEGHLKLIEGVPGDFGVRINSGKKNFGHPLFITVPVKGLDTSVTVVGYCVNDDGTLSPGDMISMDRKSGTATFSVFGPLTLVWALVHMGE